MPDSRFHNRSGPFTLATLAEIGSATLDERADPQSIIDDVAPLDLAGKSNISFLDNPKYINAFETSEAGACVVSPRHRGRAPSEMALLLSDLPYHSYALIAQVFYPRSIPREGVATNAMISPEAKIGEGSQIGAFAVVEKGAVIGRRCNIMPNAFIGPSVMLGDDVSIGACTVLSHCIIGNRVSIHHGASIGQEGFGVAPSSVKHVAVPQLGRVTIGDDVRIGSNTTIDRGSGRDTVIGAGCWIDNSVHIAHNVEVGRGAILAAQVGIAGSSTIGEFAMLGGQVGVSGHLSVGDSARIAGKSGVIRDVPTGETWGGTPATRISDWHRRTVLLSHMVRERNRDS